MDRRQFLASAAATMVIAPQVRAAQSPYTLQARPASVQIAPTDYPKTDVWAYNGSIPGDTLRCRQGDIFRANVTNALPEATTVHWHGLRLPNAMDGVPGMTQPEISPGDKFLYEFATPDAGTFWYHPHFNSVEQVSRGLSGVLIVDETTPPDVDRDEVIVLDDWRMTADAQLHESFDNLHDKSHAGRLGNYVTANGDYNLTLDGVRRGERLRLRLVNTATARVFRLSLKGLDGWIMALDGMPLEQPLSSSELVLAPAQRADLFVDVVAEDEDEAFLISTEREEDFAVTIFRVSTEVGRARRPAPPALPANPVKDPILSAARSVPMRMEGGAMRGMQSAIWKGEQLDMRQLIEAGQVWAFNGTAGMSEDPFAQVSLGETLRIPMTNDTAFPHAMHLHGHHFRTVLSDGSLGALRDTLLVNPGDTREIAFLADNPGDWMFHCHMLSHQASGMMTWIRVTA